nr:hypothetical protein [Bacteroidota bacterium]
MKKIISLSLTIIITACLGTCTSEKATPDYNKFPDDIGKIVITKCATPGCHTNASKDAAAGLSMESWEKLFEGGRAGACIIPYRSDYSTMFHYINTFPDLGITASPTMPYNKGNLTKEEVTLIKNWIDAGAPNREGFIKFSDNPERKKFYVANAACKEVTVFDQETLLPMRYINVDNTGALGRVHNIKISPDGQYWYIIAMGGSFLKKYRTSDDSFVGEAILGSADWNTITISNDGQKAYVVNFSPVPKGDVAEVDLNTFVVIHHFGFNNPHGSCLKPAGDTLYITGQSSSTLWKIPVSDFTAYSVINLYTTPPPSALNSHEVLFSPDGKKYFVTCQSTTNPEVRVFKTGTDQLLATIPVGAQ